MAALVRRGPPIRALLIIHSLHHKSVVAQSPDVPVIHSNGHRFSVKLIIAILVGVVIIALFALGFFTVYLRRFIRNRNAAADAAAIAAVTAAAIANPPNRRRRGLDRAVIDSFPSIPFSDVQCIKSNKLRYGPECAICLSGFTDEEMLRLLPGCRHVFHAACIDTWLSSHITCPVCRADLSDPLVAAAGQSLMVDLAEERCSDAVEIVVEVFHPDLDPDPNPDQQIELQQITVYPENARQELESAIQHRRAASLISFHGRRSAPAESIIRNSSIRRQTQPDSGSGQRSSRWILQNTPRHSDPGERPSKLFLHGFQSHESNGTDAAVESQRPKQEADDKNYANYVSFAGFVIRGDVAANDWLPEIFQVSTTMQSPPSY